jgi:hypothetical protein
MARAVRFFVPLRPSAKKGKIYRRQPLGKDRLCSGSIAAHEFSSAPLKVNLIRRGIPRSTLIIRFKMWRTDSSNGIAVG